MSASNESSKSAGPGRPAQATTFFRILNFELFVKPNKVIMAGGLIAITGVLVSLLLSFKVVCYRYIDDFDFQGYIGYMRSKYESAGYYAALQVCIVVASWT